MGTAQCFAYGQGRSSVIPIRSGRYLSKQTINTTGVAAQSAIAMPPGTEYVVIEVDTECHFKIDAAQSTADATSTDPTIRAGENGEFLIGAGEYFSLIE